MPRILFSVTFGQEGHLSLAVCHLARDFPSRALAIPGSQPLCCVDHGAGGRVGGVSETCLPPELCSSRSTRHEALDACVLDVAHKHVCFGSHRILKMFELFADV